MRSETQPIKRQIAFDSARFLTSAPNLDACPDEFAYEVAFAGRSNAGKSSCINALTRNSKLARTSRTPGRTQMLNFFSTSTSDFRLVDLPGYGFARVSSAMRRDWDENLAEYLEKRDSLIGLILLMDIRHPLRPEDQTFIKWCNNSRLPVHLVLTKSDKLKQSPANQALHLVQTAIKDMDNTTVQLLSSSKGSGLGQLRLHIQQWYDVNYSKQTMI